MQLPKTRYARRSDGISIAYQLFGSGPRALVFCWGWMSHLDLQWTDPGLAGFFERLSRFCQVLVFDKPGTGVSDPIAHVPTLEERVQDVRTLMDAAGLERAAILGESEAGPAAAMFAATYPERTDALIIFGSIANGRPEESEVAPYGGRAGDVDQLADRLRDSLDHWGEGRCADWIVPSLVNPMVRRAFGTYERSAVSPTMARALIDSLFQIDVRSVLGTISVPTLILHREGDVVPISHGRLLADRIPGARLVELAGSDHAIWTQDTDTIVGEIEQLLTGSRGIAAASERVLATVLFTDIVESTRRVAEMGDSAWRQLLEQHHQVVRREVTQLGGRVVQFVGDGALAVFTGPARAISCAQGILEAVGELGLELRAGIHTGECEALGEDVGGMAVHIGARVSALAAPQEILVTQTVVDLVVGSGLRFADRGSRELKGVPGTWHLASVLGQSSADRVTAEPAQGYMTGADRVTVGLARRAPGVMRALGRLAQRPSRSQGV